MRTFVISLKDATERRKLMAQQLEKLGIEFEFLDAFWGADYYDDEKFFSKQLSKHYEKRLLSPGEVGCALSHLAIYKKIIEENIPYALIFEDDAVISPDILKVLPEIEKNIKQNQMITLTKCTFSYKKGRIHLYDDYYISKPYMIKYGSIAQAPGYIITKEAAEKIYSFNFPVCVPADNWGWYRKQIDFRGIVPTQTLVHQNMSLESSIVSGVRNTEKRETIAGVLFYHFYTYWALGRLLKTIYQKTIKKLLKK